MSPIRLEDNNWASLAKIPFHTASENLPKIQFEEFVYSEWRVKQSYLVFKFQVTYTLATPHGV